MGCCVCEGEYTGWRDPQPVVFTNDTDGNGYCVFHAPKDEKWTQSHDRKLTSTEFNILVFDRVKDICARIERKEIGVWCDLTDTVFPDDIEFFEEFAKIPFPEISFSRAVFHGVADFSWIKFTDNAYFSRTNFLQRANFSSIKAGKNFLRMSQLDQLSLSNLELTSLDVEFIAFDCCNNWPSMFGLTRENVTDYKYAEELYRAMKQKAAAEHDQPQVSRWHSREKLMQLKTLLGNERSNAQLEVVEDREAKWDARAWAWLKLLWHRPHWPKVTLTGIYWATSGFGERAVRAGVWLLALLGLAFLANSITEPWVWSELPGSAAAQYTMASIPFAKDIPGEGWVKVARGFWQFLIAVQFTLFALAVRNRFRR